MAYDAAGNWVPGPNDYHVVDAGGRPVTEAGLGKDEPSQLQATQARANGEKRLEALRATVEAALKDVSTRESMLEKREREIAEREARIAAREAAEREPSSPADAADDAEAMGHVPE